MKASQNPWLAMMDIITITTIMTMTMITTMTTAMRQMKIWMMDQKAEANEMALRRVRLGLLLTEIGNQNNITVTDEDTKQAVMQQAYRFPGQEQQVIEYYNSNPDALRELAGPMFEERVMDYILEMAQVTDKETTVEALYAEAEEKAKPAKAAKEKKAAKKKRRRRKLLKKADTKAAF